MPACDGRKNARAIHRLARLREVLIEPILTRSGTGTSPISAPMPVRSAGAHRPGFPAARQGDDIAPQQCGVWVRRPSRTQASVGSNRLRGDPQRPWLHGWSVPSRACTCLSHRTWAKTLAPLRRARQNRVAVAGPVRPRQAVASDTQLPRRLQNPVGCLATAAAQGPSGCGQTGSGQAPIERHLCMPDSVFDSLAAHGRPLLRTAALTTTFVASLMVARAAVCAVANKVPAGEVPVRRGLSRQQGRLRSQRNRAPASVWDRFLGPSSDAHEILRDRHLLAHDLLGPLAARAVRSNRGP
jgi:hypothetical protein